MEAVRDTVDRGINTLIKVIGLEKQVIGPGVKLVAMKNNEISGFIQRVNEFNTNVINVAQVEGSSYEGLFSDLENNIKSLEEAVNSLQELIPTPLFGKMDAAGAADGDAVGSLEIFEFRLKENVARIEEVINQQLKNYPQGLKEEIREVYSVKVEYGGEKVLENVALVFCTVNNEVPLATIAKLVPNVKQEVSFSIPFDLFFTAQYAGLFLLGSDNQALAKLEIYPIEIMEVMKVNEDLQLKVKNNLGSHVIAVIVDESSNIGKEVELKAGEVACHTFHNQQSGNFVVYSGEFKRSNIVNH